MDKRIALAVRFEVADEFLHLLCFEDWRPPGEAYPCTVPEAPTLPLESIRPPVLGPTTRGLADERVLRVLQAIRAGAPLPPVPVICEATEGCAVLLDGAHRYFVSQKVGFARIPVEWVSEEDAELRFRYRSPNRSPG